jgi:toxin ParE1/3/4
MTRRLVVTPEAKADIRETRDWYEQRQQGLGREFIDRVLEAIDRLESDPSAGIQIYGELRRASVPQFPYGVFFAVEHEITVVLAILHDRRSPRVWRKRFR